MGIVRRTFEEETTQGISGARLRERKEKGERRKEKKTGRVRRLVTWLLGGRRGDLRSGGWPGQETGP